MVLVECPRIFKNRCPPSILLADATGKIFGLGENSYGKLGLGHQYTAWFVQAPLLIATTIQCCRTPTLLSSHLSSVSVIKIASGSHSSFAVVGCFISFSHSLKAASEEGCPGNLKGFFKILISTFKFGARVPSEPDSGVNSRVDCQWSHYWQCQWKSLLVGEK